MRLKSFFDWAVFFILLAFVVIANESIFGYKINSNQPELFRFENRDIVKTIYTSPVADKIVGYGGNIPMAIGVDENEIILDIKVLPNAETPDFIANIRDKGFFNNWIGKNINLIENNKRIDAVSGATLSSNAIADSMRITISNFLNQAIIYQFPWIKLVQLIATFVVLILGLMMFFYPAKIKKFRTYILLFNITVLGIWQGSMLSIAKLSAWLINGVPDVWQWGLLLIFLTSIILPMVKGRNFYCYNVCPFGALQDIVAKSKNKKISLSYKVANILSYFRVAMLFFCFLLMILGMVANVAMLEPFSAFKPNIAPITALLIFVISLVISFFMPRAWCKYCCPCGAFLDLFIIKRK